MHRTSDRRFVAFADWWCKLSPLIVDAVFAVKRPTLCMDEGDLELHESLS